MKRLVVDFNEWPVDANELMVRLHGWWSRNTWLLDQNAEVVAVRESSMADPIDGESYQGPFVVHNGPDGRA